MFNKLISFKSGKLESTTKKINCYYLNLPKEENKINNLKKDMKV